MTAFSAPYLLRRIEVKKRAPPLIQLASRLELQMKLRQFLNGKAKGEYRLVCGVSCQRVDPDRLGWCDIPAFDSTCLKCFLMRMEPLRVHLVSLRLRSSSAYNGCAPFFSFMQMSISAKRKHSSSCHDWRSLPTRTVPCRRNLPNLYTSARPL